MQSEGRHAMARAFTALQHLPDLNEGERADASENPLGSPVAVRLTLVLPVRDNAHGHAESFRGWYLFHAQLASGCNIDHNITPAC